MSVSASGHVVDCTATETLRVDQRLVRPDPRHPGQIAPRRPLHVGQILVAFSKLFSPDTD